MTDMFSDMSTPWSERLLAGGLHPPATEADVRLLEERLGVELPGGYRQFLLFSDGWGDCCLLRAGEAGWLRDLEPLAAEVWSGAESGKVRSVPDELYLVYGEEQESVNLRREYVPDTLLIGRWDDGMVLLNPHVRTAEGEWEAWYLASWVPGARRYRCFWDLIGNERVTRR
ncbi:SMI1/KNR4 family protein [Nonomuraea sp. PA05]|nr:SMI1/KNR4 family protein [Nonomuraea sp. PA05]TYB59732.1 SMI1/KNR4 family protein [Nonomuraea sp. PA05]